MEEENNNNEKTILDKAKDGVKNKTKNKVKSLLIKLLPKILPFIGGLLLVLLAAGIILVIQQVIMNFFSSILDIFKPADATSSAGTDFSYSLIEIDDSGAYKFKTEDVAQQILEKLDEQKNSNTATGFDTEEFGDMIDKYIRAEIKTTYPKTEKSGNDEDGIIIIKRASPELGDIIDLEYRSYKEFCDMANTGNAKALECFSINPDNFKLCLAKRNPTTTYKDAEGNVTKTEGGGISKTEIDYQKYVQNNSVPFNFLITLHLISEDVEFMEDVLKLAVGEEKINPIELTYVETVSTSKSTYEYKETKKESSQTGNSGNKNGGTSQGTTSGGNTTQTGTGEEGNVEVTKVGEVISTSYNGKWYTTNADTWLISSSKKVVKKSSTEFSVVDKQKEIKVDEFIDLIREYPKVENNFSTSPSYIFHLLQKYENTQTHEKIMRYVLFKLTDINYGVVDGNLGDVIKDTLSVNSVNKVSSANTIDRILAAAQEIHDAQMDYCWDGMSTGFKKLTSNNIEEAIDNPKKGTCCATFVWSVLYRAGYFTEEEMNTIYGQVYNSPYYLYYTLKELKWEIIENEDEWKAGDIVFMDTGDKIKKIDHVQIYAGNNMWYSAGGDPVIQSPAPYEDTTWKSGRDSWWACRPAPLETDSSTIDIDAIPGNVLDAAQKLHDIQMKEKWEWSDVGLIYNDIEQSINHPDKITCCATYVSSVLYLAGYFEAEEMKTSKGFGYNYQVSLSENLGARKWKRIEEQSELQPGDIVFMEYNSGNEHYPDHVQIYAGNDKWYNAGADMYIQSPAPYSTSSNWTSGLTWWAYRPPVLK